MRRPLPIALSLACAASAALAADSPLRPERMREAMDLKLGEWQTRSTLVDIKVEPGPGEDPAEAERVAAGMRAELAQPVTRSQCLWDDRKRLNLPGVRAPGTCEFSRLEARDGKFAATGSCGSPGSSAKIGIAIEGTYTPERLTYRSEATTSATGTGIRFRVDIESRRTGECAAPPVIQVPPGKRE